jgi:DNA-binding transcriptional ArsR family regulator
MVERLSRGPASVSDLARPFDMALPTVVVHLRVLEVAGVVTSTKLGRVRTYQLAIDGFTGAIDWLLDHRVLAERRLDRLGEILNQPITELPTEKE